MTINFKILVSLTVAGKTLTVIQSKIFEFFGSASGETKTFATHSLQEGCQELFRIDEGEKTYEVEVMVSSDVAIEKLEEKIAEVTNSMDDEAEKIQTKEYATLCKQLYGISEDKQERFLRQKYSFQVW